MAALRIDLITTLGGCAAADGWPGWWGLEGPEPDRDLEVVSNRTFDGRTPPGDRQ